MNGKIYKKRKNYGFLKYQKGGKNLPLFNINNILAIKKV